MNNTQWLQKFYQLNCNGDWEHTYGIKITTLDNPGWSMTVDLNETLLENKNFNAIKIERMDNDWIHCSVGENKFKGFCGPENLNEIIGIFRKWAEE